MRQNCLTLRARVRQFCLTPSRELPIKVRQNCLTFLREHFSGTPKPISEALAILFMRQLSLKDTQDLIDRYVKSYGQRGAAKALSRAGYRSPENCDIRQGHISRIQAGSYTMLQAPEEPPIEPISAPASTPIAARPPIPEKTPEHYLERGPVSSNASLDIKLSIEDSSIAANASPEKRLSIKEAGRDQDPREVRRQLRQELETQEELRKEREENSPPEVPRTSDYSRSEHSHPERNARISAVFSKRGEVQLDPDDKDFFGIPRLAKQPQKVVTKPYEPKTYAKLSMNAMQPYTLQSKRNRKERD